VLLAGLRPPLPMHRSSSSLRALGAGLLLLIAACGSSCRSGGGSFLVFGSSEAPHEELTAALENARKESERCLETFAGAFHLYQELSAPQAVELEKLNGQFEGAVGNCAKRARALIQRIEAVRSESQALYAGWALELEQFSTDVLRKKSEAQMREAHQRSDRALTALETAHARMDSVLLELQDYALFFHHNLNPRAIATLEDTYRAFDAEFSRLSSELKQAASELSRTIEYLDGPGPEPRAAADTAS